MICQSINDSFFTADTIITLQHCTLTWKEEFIFTYKSTQSILNKFIKVQIKKKLRPSEILIQCIEDLYCSLNALTNIGNKYWIQQLELRLYDKLIILCENTIKALVY